MSGAHWLYLAREMSQVRISDSARRTHSLARRRIPSMSILAACFGSLWSGQAAHAAHLQQPTTPPTPVLEPATTSPSIDASKSAPANTTPTSSTSPSKSDVTTGSEAANPVPSSENAAVESSSLNASDPTPEIPASLTETDAPATSPADSPPSSGQPLLRRNAETSSDGVDELELEQRIFQSIYRPASNPLRPQVIVRMGVTGGGNSDTTRGGRGMQVEAEIGGTLNQFGLSLALGGQFGLFRKVAPPPLPASDHPQPQTNHPGYETPVTLSAGPRASWGRIALLGYGFLDPRVGYDVYYSPVREYAGERPFAATVTHGPIVRVDAGFIARGQRKTKLRRVYGTSLGWHMNVGNISGDIPRSQYIFIGLFINLN